MADLVKERDSAKSYAARAQGWLADMTKKLDQMKDSYDALKAQVIHKTAQNATDSESKAS